MATVAFFPPAAAGDNARLNRFLAQLKEVGPVEARKIAGEIELEWSKSGSASMDLLLKRGAEALEAGDSRAAIEHLTALTDHAPDFAEGWRMRARAFQEAGLYGPAVADLERALALEPRHYNAIADLGDIMVKTGLPELAARAFEQVLAIHPHHEDAGEALEHAKSRIEGADL